MPLDSSLPKHLQHLMEKRQSAGRRQQDRAKSAAADAASNAAPFPASLERRKSSRRKPKQIKTRKA
jgi:hypothetical protein